MDFVKDKIKKLNQQLGSLNVEIEGNNIAKTKLKEQTQDLNADNERINKEKQQVTSAVKKLTDHEDGLTVSEHAVVRYMERVMGYDIGALKEKILNEIDPMYISIRADGKFPLATMGTAIVRDGTVVTIND